MWHSVSFIEILLSSSILYRQLGVKAHGGMPCCVRQKEG
jgi:hypothetical protein